MFSTLHIEPGELMVDALKRLQAETAIELATLWQTPQIITSDV